MKKLQLLTAFLTLLTVSLQSSAQSDDDDSLLLLIPSIAASAEPRSEPLPEPQPPTAISQVSLLNGRWSFIRLDPDSGLLLTDYFLFDSSNVVVSAPNAVDPGAAIIGESHRTSDFNDFLNEASVVYLSNENLWVIFDFFGRPLQDLASAYVFTEVGNQIIATHAFVIGSTGEPTTGVFSNAIGTRLSATPKVISSKTGDTPNTITREERISRLVELNETQKQQVSSQKLKAEESEQLKLARKLLK